MTTDSKTIKLTVLAKSDQAGQLENFPEGGTELEFPVGRILGVTAYFGPGSAASIVTLKPQKGNDDAFQLLVLQTKDTVFTFMSLAKGYDLTAARRPMEVEPMALPVASAAAERVVAKPSTSTPHHPRAAVTAGSGF